MIIYDTYIVSVYSLSTDSCKTVYTNFYSDHVYDYVNNPATKFVDGAACMVAISSLDLALNTISSKQDFIFF